MMKEQVILGAVLVVMGGVQMWLRWGPWAKEQQEAQQALAKRRAEAVGKVACGEETDNDAPAPEEAMFKGPVLMDRGSKLWTKWTAILGPLGIALGVALVIWGVVGG